MVGVKVMIVITIGWTAFGFCLGWVVAKFSTWA